MKVKNLFQKGIGVAALLVASWTLNAQTVDFEWAKNSGGDKQYTIGKSVAVDKEGNVYATGTFTGKTSFYQEKTILDPWLTSKGTQDAFVTKHNSKGSLIWVKQFGAKESVASGNSITIDVENGFLYVTGIFRNEIIISDKVASLTSTEKSGDIYVAKLNLNGDYQWARRYGGKGEDEGMAIALDKQSDVYITGYFSETVNFNELVKNPTKSMGQQDAFILKLQAEKGDFMWLKQIGGDGQDRGTGIAINDLGVYATGSFSEVGIFDPIDFGYKIQSQGATDIYVTKLDRNGKFEWAKSFGGDSEDFSNAIAIDNEGNAYTTGLFSEKADFNPDEKQDFILEGDGKGDIFISKLNIKGDFVWAKQMGGDSRDMGNDIAVDIDQNVYSIGNFLWTVDFDPGEKKNVIELKGNGIYIHKLNRKGEFDWVKILDCPEYGDGFGIALDDKKSIYSTGDFSKTVDFDPSAGVKELKALGTQDMFVHKMNQSTCTSESSFPITACDSYEWSGQVFTATGNYKKVFQNQAKCDSTVTLILTINNSAKKELKEVACDSYVFFGKTITQSGQYTQVAKTVKNCDSTIVLNLEITKSSKNAITETACDSFTLDGSTFYTKTGTFDQKFKNKVGCDSVVTLSLTVTQSKLSEVKETACGSYTLGDEIYDETGVYTQKFISSQKCDSTVILDLIVNKVDATVSQNDKVLTANAVGATYQWIDCDDENKAIDKETNQFFRATKNGQYAVVVTQNGCTDTSDCFEVKSFDDVGINSISFAGNLTIYPNPTNGVMTVSVERSLQNASATLMNTVGQVIVKKENIYGSTFNIDLSSYASGIYLIELQESNKTFRVKVVKK